MARAVRQTWVVIRESLKTYDPCVERLPLARTISLHAVRAYIKLQNSTL